MLLWVRVICVYKNESGAVRLGPFARIGQQRVSNKERHDCVEVRGDSRAKEKRESIRVCTPARVIFIAASKFVSITERQMSIEASIVVFRRFTAALLTSRDTVPKDAIVDAMTLRPRAEGG